MWNINNLIEYHVWQPQAINTYGLQAARGLKYNETLNNNTIMNKNRNDTNKIFRQFYFDPLNETQSIF